MPKAKVLKPLRYLNRMLEVGDEFEVMPGDVRWATSRGRAEVVSEDAPRRGRPPKAEGGTRAGPYAGREPEAPEPTRSGSAGARRGAWRRITGWLRRQGLSCAI